MPLIASELDPIAAELYAKEIDARHVVLHLLHSLLVAFSWPWFLVLLGCLTCAPPRPCFCETLLMSFAGLLLGGYVFAGRVIRNLHHVIQPSFAYVAFTLVLLAFEVAIFCCIFWQPACIEQLLSTCARSRRARNDPKHNTSAK